MGHRTLFYQEQRATAVTKKTKRHLNATHVTVSTAVTLHLFRNQAKRQPPVSKGYDKEGKAYKHTSIHIHRTNFRRLSNLFSIDLFLFCLISDSFEVKNQSAKIF